MSDIAIRRAHAEQELIARGVIGPNGLPPGMRLILRLFPHQKVPFYGDYWLAGLQLGVMFGLPMAAFIGWICSLGDKVSVGLGLGLGAAGGVAFGGVFALYLPMVHRRAKLSDWAALDRPPGAAVPERAQDIADINKSFLRDLLHPSGEGD